MSVVALVSSRGKVYRHSRRFAIILYTPISTFSVATHWDFLVFAQYTRATRTSICVAREHYVKRRARYLNHWHSVSDITSKFRSGSKHIHLHGNHIYIYIYIFAHTHLQWWKNWGWGGLSRVLRSWFNIDEQKKKKEKKGHSFFWTKPSKSLRVPLSPQHYSSYATA